MEGWKVGRWPSYAKASVGKKDGRLEEWKVGRVEGWKDGWRDGEMESWREDPNMLTY